MARPATPTKLKLLRGETRPFFTLVFSAVMGAVAAVAIGRAFGWAPAVGVIVKSVPAVGLGVWWLTRKVPLLPTLALFVPLIALTAFLPLAAQEIGLAFTIPGLILTLAAAFNPRFMLWWLVRVWRVDPDQVDFS